MLILYPCQHTTLLVLVFVLVLDSNSELSTNPNPQVEVETLTGVCAEGEGPIYCGLKAFIFYHFPPIILPARLLSVNPNTDSANAGLGWDLPKLRPTFKNDEPLRRQAGVKVKKAKARQVFTQAELDEWWARMSGSHGR